MAEIEARIEDIKRVEKIGAERLVPTELKGRVVFKTFPATGNLYALVKKMESFEDAEVTLSPTTAIIT